MNLPCKKEMQEILENYSKNTYGTHDNESYKKERLVGMTLLLIWLLQNN